MKTQSKTFKFQDYGSTLGLSCPRCGSDYLHHTGAEFFERDEDGPSEIKITVEGGTVRTSVIPSTNSGNPSTRRHGMKVIFFCENCKGENGDAIEMNIAQHKGMTELSWTFSPPQKNST
ncbi:MAG: hypothetical protein J0G95_09000 [Rhizobiales bacterium]|nr:hypothetical protein [Hyphomicrobiales bacterium]